MKPHIIIKLRPESSILQLPHWRDILGAKNDAPTRFIPEIDTILDRFRIQVWATHEHAPCQGEWSDEEVASGLNRLYRLVLHYDTAIPQDLIDAILLVPVVERVTVSRVGQSPLPEVQTRQPDPHTDMVSREQIFLPQAHLITEGSPQIVVAVLDTGIETTHPELQDVLMSGHDFVDIIHGAGQFIGDYAGVDPDPDDEVGHGTHVAGIIGAKGLNMPKGVAPCCRILPVRVLAAMKRGKQRVGAGLVENIDVGVKWAVDQGADIINMSLGVVHEGGGLPHEEVMAYAERKDVTVVAASGNDGEMRSYYPGAFESVIAVGASSPANKVAAFSTYGPQVSFIAPGTNIFSSYLDNGYAFSSGTSQATPFVAGAVAILKSWALSRGYTLNNRQVKHILKHTSDKVGRRFKHIRAGFGQINIWDALKLTQYKLTT